MRRIAGAIARADVAGIRWRIAILLNATLDNEATQKLEKKK
jgi:hypothetical protein